MRVLAAAIAPLPIAAAVVLAGTANASTQPLVAVPHNTNPALAHSTRVSNLPADDQLNVTVALNLHNAAQLNNFLTQVSDPHSAQYRHYLTPQQFDAQYAPSTADVTNVRNYLAAQGLKVGKVSANRQAIDASGTEAQLSKAFSTSFGSYTDNSSHRAYYANDTAPQLPGNVAGLVAGISGLDNHAVEHSMATKANTKPTASPDGFTPSQLSSAYDTASLSPATGQTIALWEFDGYDSSNISEYDSQFSIDAPAPKTVSVDGSNYDSSPGEGQGEVELDIEIVQAISGGAKTEVYEAPNSDQGQIDMANQIVSDNTANVVSISWGECEADSAAATLTSTDDALKQGAAEGISFYSASGDSGSADCQDGSTGVDYPASDPNVTGVGGTTLSASDGYGSETAWDGSGGGVSNTFDAPSYQTGSGGKRTVPDVSSDADPNSGYAIYSAGEWQVYGGTRCAAPLWAGWTALDNTASGSSLGDGNAAFYGAGSGFHDITSGSNGGFDAGTGYDEVTGLGSYDGAALTSALG
jgi:subtilase family serine protease